jgi:hypothetical protein
MLDKKHQYNCESFLSLFIRMLWWGENHKCKL